MITVEHTCGYLLQRRDEPQMHDITSINDAPEHMRPVWSGVGYIDGIPLDRLPMQYHKFIQVGTHFHWYHQNKSVRECPNCKEVLQDWIPGKEKQEV